MLSKTVSIILVMSWLSGLRLSFAQQPAPCLAVITEINGEVTVKKADKDEFVKALWGTQLFQGDQVKTSAKSKVTLAFSNGNFVSMEQTSSLTLSGKDSPVAGKPINVRNISSAMMVNLSALTMKKNEKKDVGALADLRSANADQTIELSAPLNTIIKTNRPAFSWLPRKAYDNYIVNLYSSKGLVWSKKVSTSSLKYPENEKGLEFGESYFWNVEGEDLLDNKKSANNKFSILPLEKSWEVEQQEAMIRKTFKDEPESGSLHSVLGAYYINQGLLQDAIVEFQIISRINTNAPLPHEILGSLYSDVGNKDKAIEELQKALALAKNNKE